MKFLAKNFNQVNNKLIIKEDLLRLNIYILVLNYLEEEKSYLTIITKEYNKKSNIDNNKNEPIIANLKEKAMKKKVLYKKKKIHRVYYL